MIKILELIINNLTNINYLLVIISAVFSFAFFSFFLDGFRLAKNLFINFIQLLIYFICLICIISYIFFLFKINIIYLEGTDDAIKATIQTTKDANIIGTVTIPQDSLVNTTSKIANNLGLGSAIGGLGGAVATAIKNSAIPTAQKAALVIGGGLLGGAIQNGFSQINPLNNNSSNTTSNINNSINTNKINTNSINSNDNFNTSSPHEPNILDFFLNPSLNPVEIIFASIYTLNILSIIFLINLVFALLPKLFKIDSLEFN
jgi:hypothetical protein